MSSTTSRIIIGFASAGVLLALGLAGCSQATEHPPPASDGNSPGFAFGAGSPPTDAGAPGTGDAGTEPGAGGVDADLAVDAGDSGVGTDFGTSGGIPGAAGLGATGTGETIPPVVRDDAGSGTIIIF